MDKKSRACIFISGRVQGVFFRDNVLNKAFELELRGWVMNLSDGRVKIVAEGKNKDIEKMISWVKKGPPLAKVEKVEIVFEKHQGEFQDFRKIS